MQFPRAICGLLLAVSDSMAVIVLLLFLTSAYCDVLNPCSEYLNYGYENSEPAIFLSVPNDYTGYYVLNVSTSVPFYTNKTVKINSLNYEEIINKPVDFIKYVIRFPFSTHPKVTKVDFNGRTLCTDNGYTLDTNSAVTNFRSFLMIQSTIQNRGKFGTTSTIVNRPIRIETTTNVPVVTGRSQLNNVCGQGGNSHPLIIKGKEAYDGEYPWMVALFYYDKKKSKYIYHCVGNLITVKHVLTSGHCFKIFNALIFPPEQILAVLGRTTLDDVQRETKTSDIAKIEVHPDYKHNHGGHDIAILTLAKPAQIDRFVRPICLSDDSIQQNRGIVAGWGQDKFKDPEEAMVLKKVDMEISTQQECLRSHAAFFNLTSKETFCAGTKDRSGPCVGDSGAGFFIKLGNLFYLRGIVAYSLASGGTCDLNNYVVFADISREENWIKGTINN